MTEQPNILERDGPKGGKYYFVNLSDGRQLHVSRNESDRRVWLGRPDVPGSYYGQPGGIGRIDKLLDEWGARSDSEGRELYAALKALASSRTLTPPVAP
jgi:hypothetical protein